MPKLTNVTLCYISCTVICSHMRALSSPCAMIANHLQMLVLDMIDYVDKVQ